jgi:gamma-glutamylcyclotransferase (GGCT)/AIG2-like uncharacterized protein YtfP
MTNNKTTIFVYGTLREGSGNWRGLLAPLKGKEAKTNQKYRMLSYGGFPAVYKVEENGVQITGELFVIDDPTLERVDLLEGNPTWYNREEIKVTTKSGEEVVAWMYIMPDDGYASTKSEIPSGDWKRRAEGCFSG